MIWKPGDIVVRCDIKGRTKYVVVSVATDGSGWVYARPLRGGSVVTFPSQFMIKRAK